MTLKLYLFTVIMYGIFFFTRDYMQIWKQVPKSPSDPFMCLKQHGGDTKRLKFYFIKTNKQTLICINNDSTQSLLKYTSHDTSDTHTGLK